AFMTLFADQPERAEGLDENLACALLTAVPMRIWEITHWTPEQRANDAAWAAELMRAGAAGDVLLYGAKDGRPAAAFSALVRGLAALDAYLRAMGGRLTFEQMERPTDTAVVEEQLPFGELALDRSEKFCRGCQ